MFFSFFFLAVVRDTSYTVEDASRIVQIDSTRAMVRLLRGKGYGTDGSADRGIVQAFAPVAPIQMQRHATLTLL